MHDLDRIRLLPRAETDISYEADGLYDELFSDAEAEELAYELLGAVESDQELDLFLGKVISQAARRARRLAGRAARGASRHARDFANSRLGQDLKKVAKGTARKAIEGAGGALVGSAFGRIGLDAKSGRAVGSAAGKILSDKLGLEFEGLDLEAEDLEMEAAKRVVRATAEATRKAIASAGTSAPRAVAQKAMVQGAAKVARASAPPSARARTTRDASGRWVRRGRRIVLYGV